MIKEFKSGDGCRFMCTCLPGSTSVFDMDVDDGVEVVEFEGFDDVSIGKVAEKSFPSVKTLVIGEEVECMSIPNEMFPNVRNIISYNRHFLNSDMLIRVDYNMLPDKNGKRTDVWLLNTFCKKPDEVINLKSVEFIDGYAFYGCRSTKIINEDCVKGGFKLAFFGSAFMELEPVGGAYMAGSMIIDVDKDAKELVIPETATYFLHNIHNVTFIRELCKSYDKIIVKNSSLFFQRVLYAYAAPKNLVIDCEVYDDKEDFCNYIKNCSNLQNIQITDKSERYMTYDGVLYDKAGKTLLACPKNRHGTVKIKEGTKEIEKNAFENVSTITTITINDTAKVDDEAFKGAGGTTWGALDRLNNQSVKKIVAKALHRNLKTPLAKVAKASLKKAKAAKNKKKANLKWTKSKNANGYIVYCKVVKKGKKAGKIAWKKVKTVKKPKTTKCTVKISAKQRKVLKKKGKIYYSVRAYKKVTVNGKKKTIYSVYSQKKLK